MALPGLATDAAASTIGAREMLRTIGLMSGTSLDGVDAAWLEPMASGSARSARR